MRNRFWSVAGGTRDIPHDSDRGKLDLDLGGHAACADTGPGNAPCCNPMVAVYAAK